MRRVNRRTYHHDLNESLKHGQFFTNKDEVLNFEIIQNLVD